MKYTLLCFANVLLLVTGQVLFKIGMQGKSFDSLISIFKTMFSPIILTGLMVYGFTTILWLHIISKMPINRAYPIQALAYPIMMILASYLFHESIPTMRWIGIGVVFVGIILIVQ